MYSFLAMVDTHYHDGKRITEAINGNYIGIVIQHYTAITAFC